MLIQLDGVRKTYRTGGTAVPVLHGISLGIELGEYLALVGRSGSGKSTLMNVMGLLDRFDTGRYTLGGKDVGRLGGAQVSRIRNRSIGFVFQSFNLLPRKTALENVALPMLYAGLGRSEARRRGVQLLERVGLSGLGDRRPHQLSGGQQQRVAVARAFANDPSLILADEPTGSLDTHAAQSLLETLEALNRDSGVTVVVVTHEPGVACRARRVVRLADGAVSFDGPPSGDPLLSRFRTDLASASPARP